MLKCLDFYNRYIEIQFNVVGCCFFFYTFSVILNQDLSDIYCGLFLSSRLFFYFLTKIITREEGHHFYYNKINCYGCLFFIIIFFFYMYLYLVYTIQMWCQPNCIFYSFLVSWENYVIQYNVPKEWQQIPAFSMWIEKCWRCSTFFLLPNPKYLYIKKIVQWFSVLCNIEKRKIFYIGYCANGTKRQSLFFYYYFKYYINIRYRYTYVVIEFML